MRDGDLNLTGHEMRFDLPMMDILVSINGVFSKETDKPVPIANQVWILPLHRGGLLQLPEGVLRDFVSTKAPACVQTVDISGKRLRSAQLRISTDPEACRCGLGPIDEV